jgi:hypothetical protein
MPGSSAIDIKMYMFLQLLQRTGVLWLNFGSVCGAGCCSS